MPTTLSMPSPLPKVLREIIICPESHTFCLPTRRPSKIALFKGRTPQHARRDNCIGRILTMLMTTAYTALFQIEAAEDSFHIAQVGAGAIFWGGAAVFDKGADGSDDREVVLVIGEPPVVNLGVVPVQRHFVAEGGGVNVPEDRGLHVSMYVEGCFEK